MDENNQKRRHKLVGRFLYYAISIDPTMLMALNSLEEVQTKPTTKIAKQITQILNYSASNPDAVTEYRRSRMVLQIYLDASYMLEPKALRRAGGYFSWDQNTKHQYKQCPWKMDQCM